MWHTSPVMAKPCSAWTEEVGSRCEACEPGEGVHRPDYGVRPARQLQPLKRVPTLRYVVLMRRTVPVRERMKFELRGDFFNILNRTNLSAPNGTFGTPNFARITGARLPRTIQLGLKFWF